MLTRTSALISLGLGLALAACSDDTSPNTSANADTGDDSSVRPLGDVDDDAMESDGSSAGDTGVDPDTNTPDTSTPEDGSASVDSGPEDTDDDASDDADTAPDALAEDSADGVESDATDAEADGSAEADAVEDTAADTAPDTETDTGSDTGTTEDTSTGEDVASVDLLFPEREVGQCTNNSVCPDGPGGRACAENAPGGICNGCLEGQDCPGAAECIFATCITTCLTANDCPPGLACGGTGRCGIQDCVDDVCPNPLYTCDVSNRCARVDCSEGAACPDGTTCTGGWCIENRMLP
jgi:hypothetical protein